MLGTSRKYFEKIPKKYLHLRRTEMLCLLEQYTPLKSHSIVWSGMPFWITLYISGVSHVVSVTWRIKPSPYPETGWNICFDKFNMWEQELGPWNNLDLELFGGFSQCGVCFYLKHTHTWNTLDCFCFLDQILNLGIVY